MKNSKQTLWARFAALGIIASALLISGCATDTKKAKDLEADIIYTSHAAADSLINKLTISIDRDKPIITTSLVNIDNLEGSSSLGRIVSEQIASRISQQGYRIIEMKLRKSVFIKQGAGEFMLSREVRSISRNHDAQAVVVGSYAVGQEKVYITIRIVRTPDSAIIASHDYTLPISADVRTLLRNNARR